MVLPAGAAAAATTCEIVERVWDVLRAFASFGFCKAHAAAFALPTYQSAWLKAHHPAAFLAGVLTHDPGMYPKRLILDDARNLGHRDPRPGRQRLGDYRRPGRAAAADPGGAARRRARPARRQRPRHPAAADRRQGHHRGRGGADRRRPALRLPVGLLAAGTVVHARWSSDWCVAGGFDTIYGIDLSARCPAARPGDPSRPPAAGRRPRAAGRSARASSGRGRRAPRRSDPGRPPRRAGCRRLGSRPGVGAGSRVPGLADPALAAAAQSQAPAAVRPSEVQLSLELPMARSGPRQRAAGDDRRPSGCAPSSTSSGWTSAATSSGLLRRRCWPTSASCPSRDLLAPALPEPRCSVAGVKVATQTPPIRSGRRVVFLTLDDSTGPVDATFFEDAQGPYASTVFGSLAAAGPRADPAHRPARHLDPGDRLLGARGRARDLAGRRPGRSGRVHRLVPDGRHPGAQGRRGHRRPGRGGSGPLGRRWDARRSGSAGQPPVGWASAAGSWCTPAGSGSRRTPTSSRRGGPGRRTAEGPSSP